jgi:hypothetical protein
MNAESIINDLRARVAALERQVGGQKMSVTMIRCDRGNTYPVEPFDYGRFADWINNVGPVIVNYGRRGIKVGKYKESWTGSGIIYHYYSGTYSGGIPAPRPKAFSTLEDTLVVLWDENFWPWGRIPDPELPKVNLV